jgi:hypothetical protein
MRFCPTFAASELSATSGRDAMISFCLQLSEFLNLIFYCFPPLALFIDLSLLPILHRHFKAFVF